MGLFKRKADPISERTKALTAQIASLEAQIKRLDNKLQHEQEPAMRPGHDMPWRRKAGPKDIPRRAREAIFESVDQSRLHAAPEDDGSPAHYNDLGVRKYDLVAAWRRWRDQFRSPPVSNPKLVTYLAAGSIKGLRPLRYEKRIARNRFIALFLLFVALLWGIIYSVFRGH